MQMLIQNIRHTFCRYLYGVRYLTNLPFLVIQNNVMDFLVLMPEFAGPERGAPFMLIQ